MIKDRGVLDAHQLGEALGPAAGLLGRRCGTAAVKLLRDRLVEAIGAHDGDRYSYMWRPAVEEHEQNIRNGEYRSALLAVLRDSALGAAAISEVVGSEVLQMLLVDSYPTLRRVGIYVAAESYATLGECFWRYFDDSWLLEPVYWHELYWLLKKNYRRFSAPQRSRFLALALSLRGDWRGADNAGELDERQRRDVLQPISGQGDEEVDGLYGDLVKRWGPGREHPDFHTYHGPAAWVSEKSPVTTEGLLALSDSDLTKFLSDFEPQPRAWDGPTFHGLALTISDAVRASTDGFASKLRLFTDLKRPYQYGVLNGLHHRVADDKKSVDWGMVVSFLEQVVASPSFCSDLQKEKPEGWEPSIFLVVVEIANILKAGAVEGTEVTRELLERGARVLLQVLTVLAPEPAADLQDPVSHTINAPRGRSLEVLIHIALALRRPAPTDLQLSDDVWQLIGPTLDAELDLSVRGANGEFAALAGLYCANLHYLNAAWVERRFDHLFSIKNDSAWRCAAEGFSYQVYLYEWLFRKLSDGGHLRRMIQLPEASRQIVEKALQFLALAYLEGHEDLDPAGTLGEVVEGLEARHVTQLCWFFWTLRGAEVEVGVTGGRSFKILEFWRRVSKTVHGTGAEVPEIRSALNLLSAFILELDESTTKLWSDVAGYAQVSYHGNVLLENLARLAPRFPTQVFQVFKSALMRFLPEFDEADLIRCVRSIAEAGYLDEAEWLCNEYANRGSGLLRSTYDMLRGRPGGSPPSAPR